jgi:hypothetical protein
MTILYDSIPGRFEDPVELMRLRRERSRAYEHSLLERQAAGHVDQWVVEILAPKGGLGRPSRATLKKVHSL